MTPANVGRILNGNSRLLLNINNRYFLHYDLLYEYSDFMISSRNTLFKVRIAPELRKTNNTSEFDYPSFFIGQKTQL